MLTGAQGAQRLNACSPLLTYLSRIVDCGCSGARSHLLTAAAEAHASLKAAAALSELIAAVPPAGSARAAAAAAAAADPVAAPMTAAPQTSVMAAAAASAAAALRVEVSCSASSRTPVIMAPRRHRSRAYSTSTSPRLLVCFAFTAARRVTISAGRAIAAKHRRAKTILSASEPLGATLQRCVRMICVVTQLPV